MLVSEAFQSYAADVIVFKNQSRKTEENHFVVMKALIVHFGDIHIEKLEFTLIRDWKLALEKCRSPETVRNYIIKLRVVLKYLRERSVNCIPPEQIPVPKRRDKVPLFLTSEQVSECIDGTKQVKNKAIVSLLYSSGVRVSELCALDRGCMHNNTFTVIGKGGRARLCFVDERSAKLLRQYLNTRRDNEQALFLTASGKRITSGVIQETFKSIRRKTGYAVHPHTLRHSFATNLLESNTNLYYVSKLLGHRQLTTTQQYLHAIDEDLKKVYNEHHTF